MNGMSNIAQNLIANVVCEINLTINAKAQRPHIAVSLANMPLRGLYNSGADVSCIDEAVFRKIPVDKRPEKLFLDPKLRFNSASSDRLDVKGLYRLSVGIGKKAVTHSFYVICRLSEEMILGFDFIQTDHLNFCTTTRNLSWNSEAKWGSGRLKVSEQMFPSRQMFPLKAGSCQSLA